MILWDWEKFEQSKITETAANYNIAVCDKLDNYLLELIGHIKRTLYYLKD